MTFVFCSRGIYTCSCFKAPTFKKLSNRLRSPVRLVKLIVRAVAVPIHIFQIAIGSNMLRKMDNKKHMSSILRNAVVNYL
tara:strand:+ start:316 stop:555 length:240 start_codon:yes stop_codon:yes gene_type:complete